MGLFTLVPSSSHQDSCYVWIFIPIIGIARLQPGFLGYVASWFWLNMLNHIIFPVTLWLFNIAMENGPQK
jgi:hypothetical protein